MQWQTELIHKLKECKTANERSALIESYAKTTNKSVATIYRQLKKHGYDSGRQRRSDSGSLKSGLNDKQIDFVVALMEASARDNKGVIMPVETALEIAQDEGVIASEQISVSRLQGILRERGMSAAILNTPAPSIQQRSLHPNHVHFMDVSVCIQYYLKNGKMAVRKERDYYENKIENFKKIKNRLLRYVLTDHYSGAFFVKYYYVGGENQQSLFDFLISTWSPKNIDIFPFRGVPKILRMDSGSANISKAILAFCERLGVSVMPGTPHTPRSQGSVERAHIIVERNFETKLRFQPATDMELLNNWAEDFCAYYNSKKIHRRTGETRSGCWLSINTDQLRELPTDRALLHDLFANPTEERTVANDYTISFKGETYSVRHIPALIPRKSKVLVILKPFLHPTIGVKYKDEEYECTPIKIIDGGFRETSAIIGEEYKSVPESTAERAAKRAENLAYGEERKKDDIAFGGTLDVMGHQAEKIKTTYISKKGVAIEIEKEEKKISTTQFIKRVMTETGRMTPELNRQIRALYPSGIGTLEARRRIDEIRETGGIDASDTRKEADSAKTHSA